jgi:hypothetical protein
MASEVSLPLRTAADAPERARRRRARVRETRLDDYAQIAKLHLRNGLGVKSRSEWADLWLCNPSYLRENGKWPIGWVIEGEHGEIFGSIANIPLDYSYQGQLLRGAASCSWAVDPEYRAYSMMMLDILTNQPRLDLLVSTTVSASVEPAFRMFHWSKVPAGTWDQSAFWIADYAGFARHVLKMKSVPMSELLSYPLSAALYGWDKLGRRRVRDGNAEIEAIGAIDHRFDGFWRQWETENSGRLLAVRTRESLSWHFHNALSRSDAWVVTASRGSRLGAYAMFDRHEDTASGLKRVRLVDFAALRECENLFPAVLRFALGECQEQGVHMLQTTGLWLRDSWTSACPPAHYRSLPSWSFYYRAASPDLASALRDPKVWAPTSFDGDASL